MSTDPLQAAPAPAGAGTPLEGPAEPGPGLDDLIEFRRPTVEDIGFIKKNWLRITRGEMPTRLDSKTFYEEHDELIGRLATCCDAWIACDKNYAFYIYGFVVGAKNSDGSAIVHFLFTRDEWRQRGVARRLLAQLGLEEGKAIYASHWSRWLKPKKFFCPVEWNPYTLKEAYRAK